MQDFLIDENTNEMKFLNGDFAFGDSTKQNQKALLLANKNSYKESPLIGVGIMSSIDDDSNDLLRDIRIEMVRDGMTINELKVISPGKINLDAEYK
jgi:hypothetical protein